MKILFVSGKGGVGKSTVAAALALRKAREGHKTLLVELGDTSFYGFALGNSVGKSLGTTPQPWREGVDLAVWDGPSCLREYALHLIKSETLYKLFFENRVSKSLIQVAPGLPELAMIGKVTSGPPRNIGPKIPYDVIVVDAFASGHFLALMNAPLGFSKAIHLGPMAEQTAGILQVLRDPSICEYFFVTLAEALPLQETHELISRFRENNSVSPQIVFNRWLPADVRQSLPATSGGNDFLADLQRRREQQEAAEAAFAADCCWCLPWILANQFEETVLSAARDFSPVQVGKSA